MIVGSPNGAILMISLAFYDIILFIHLVMNLDRAPGPRHILDIRGHLGVSGPENCNFPLLYAFSENVLM